LGRGTNVQLNHRASEALGKIGRIKKKKVWKLCVKQVKQESTFWGKTRNEGGHLNTKKRLGSE